MTIEELPTFTVNTFEGDHAVGSFDRIKWMGEGHLADLLLTNGRLLGGRFTEVDAERRTAAFTPSNPEDLATLQIGERYRRFDGYWGERAALVLDRELRWEERTFEPTDAVRFDRENDYLLGKPTNEEMPSGGSIVKGGWDHEHCKICWAKIAPQDEPTGMFSPPDHWICVGCYSQYVVPRSLDFIGDRE